MSEYVMLVKSMNNLENVNHAVHISGLYIYDANNNKPLPLVKNT